jgi:hypothetical protein
MPNFLAIILLTASVFGENIKIEETNSKKVEEKNSKKFKWRQVKPLLTTIVTSYGTRECCGVHRSAPCKYTLVSYQ